MKIFLPQRNRMVCSLLRRKYFTTDYFQSLIFPKLQQMLSVLTWLIMHVQLHMYITALLYVLLECLHTKWINHTLLICCKCWQHLWLYFLWRFLYFGVQSCSANCRKEIYNTKNLQFPYIIHEIFDPEVNRKRIRIYWYTIRDFCRQHIFLLAWILSQSHLMYKKLQSHNSSPITNFKQFIQECIHH